MANIISNVLLTFDFKNHYGFQTKCFKPGDISELFMFICTYEKKDLIKPITLCKEKDDDFVKDLPLRQWTPDRKTVAENA